MKLGFTGTRTGMNAAQRRTFGQIVTSRYPIAFCHGDCIGADADAHVVVRASLPSCFISIRPGPQTALSADCEGDERHPPKAYFARNRDIVDTSDALIACPPCKPLPMKGGTLFTISYAVKTRKPCVIIWPDGTIESRCHTSSPVVI